jgi:Cu+-exporting ATPase
MKKNIPIKGMSCTACAAAIERSVRKLDGIKSVGVNFASEKMQVDFDPEKTNLDAIRGAVVSAGYEAVIDEGKEKTPAMKNEAAESLKRRLIGSIVFTVPLLYLAMGPMLGLPIPSFLTGMQNALILALAQLFLTIPVLIIGKEFYRAGGRSLWKLSPNMDALVAVGTAASFIYGVFVVFMLAYGFSHGDMNVVERYAHDLYFESAGVILTLITVGKYLEARAKRKTGEAVKKLMALAPETAVLIRDGKQVTVPIEEVREGDTFIVKPGSRVPVDGVITEGYTSVDESMLTGESLPVEKNTGNTVIAGSINRAGSVTCRATQVGQNTVLSKIIQLVEEAQGTKAPIAKLADRVSAVFVPVVLGIALVTFIVWMAVGQGLTFALTMAVSVLVVSCPCALGLATPTAIMVGTGKGAQYGVLFKSGEALQNTRRADTIVLDKTGTLTEGVPSVTDIVPYGMDEKELLTLAASAETLSEHPLSEAIVRKAGDESLSLGKAEDFQAVVGKGLTATVDGKKVLIGNEKLMTENGISLTDGKAKAEALADEGKTPLYVASEGMLAGIIAVADTLKAQSPEAVARLREQGIEVVMITGDNARTANAIARMAGIDKVLSGVLPQDKAEAIKKMQAEGRRVVMVGDGINDAVALVQADVGVSVGSGTDVAMESADVVLMKNNIMDVVTAMELSRATLRTIKQNLFWAFFYNVIGIPIAAGVLYTALGLRLNPMIAAAAMSFSSVTVVGNALRLSFALDGRRKKEMKESGESCPTGVCPIEIQNLQEGNEMIMTKTLTVEGMTCMHCVNRVKTALEGVEGVTKADVSLEEKRAVVEGNGFTDEAMKQAVADAGYEVTDVK